MVKLEEQHCPYLIDIIFKSPSVRAFPLVYAGLLLTRIEFRNCITRNVRVQQNFYFPILQFSLLFLLAL